MALMKANKQKFKAEADMNQEKSERNEKEFI